MATDPNTLIDSYDQQVQDLQGELEGSSSYYGAYGEPSSSDLSTQLRLNSLRKKKSDLLSKQSAANWYGTGKPEEQVTAEPQQGLFMKALDTLSRPLYAEVGAVKYLTGKAEPGQTLAQSIDANMQKNKDTYGSLLRQFHVPLVASMPAGLAMDIVLDPVNILPFWGISSGKVARGIRAGGTVGKDLSRVGGAKLAAESSLLGGLTKFVHMIPGLSEKSALVTKDEVTELSKQAARYMDVLVAKKASEEEIAKKLNDFVYQSLEKMRKAKAVTAGAATKAGGFAKNLVKQLEAKNLAKQLKYEEFVGGVLDDSRAAQNFGEKMAGMVKAVPGGEKLYDWYSYNLKADNTAWMKASMWKDEILQFAQEHGLKIGRVQNPVTKEWEMAKPEQINELITTFWDQVQAEAKVNPVFAKRIDDMSKKMLTSVEDAKFKTPITAGGKTDVLNKEFNKIVDEGIGISNTHQLANVDTTYSNGLKMAAEAKKEGWWNDYTRAYKEMATGSEAQIPLREIFPRIASWKVFSRNVGTPVLNTYEKLIGIFKSSKVSPLNPASMTYAILGNLAMAHMAGIDVTRKDYYQLLKLAWDYNSGKAGAESITKLFDSPEMKKFMAKYPETFAKILGFAPATMNFSSVMNDAFTNVLKDAKIDSKQMPEIKNQMEAMMLNFVQKGSAYRKLRATPTPTEFSHFMGDARIKPEYKGRVEDLAKVGLEPEQMGSPVNLATIELSGSEMTKLLLGLEIKEMHGANAVTRTAAKYLRKAIDQSKTYQRIDQTYRLATIALLHNRGVTEPELIRLSKMIKIKNADISTADTVKGMVANRYSKNGQWYYRLNPEKSFEAANEIYMNYATMPAAVKMLRSLPILGSPFFSFQFLMAQKALKTAVYNPTAYNKVAFLLNEIQGDKSPLEKAALKNKVYNWYQTTPGMVSLSAIPFFRDNPIILNAANYIPYLQMNMFNPSERKYGKGLPNLIARIIDASPVMKTPDGQMIIDYFVMPHLLSLAEEGTVPQNQFGGPLYPSDASALEKYVALPARTYAESFMPSAIGAVAGTGLAIPWQGALLDYLPIGYQGRKVGRAALGQTPVGVSSKEPALSRYVRSVAAVLGAPTQTMNLNYVPPKSKTK